MVNRSKKVFASARKISLVNFVTSAPMDTLIFPIASPVNVVIKLALWVTLLVIRPPVSASVDPPTQDFTVKNVPLGIIIFLNVRDAIVRKKV